jgi:alkaline phosphatase
MMKTRNLLGLVLVLLASCAPARLTEVVPVHKKLAAHTRPKNIILMIGDGMGLTQLTAGMYVNGNQLQLERCRISGLIKTYAADDLVTDSAAGATAFACGIKTYNGAIGVDLTGKPVKTILEEAVQRGLSTGMITTSTITHATPASFIAHVRSREMEEEIATFFPESGLDFFVGGGKKFFDRREKDDKNLVQALQKKGYVISHYAEAELRALTPDPSRPFGYFSADGSPLTVESGRDYLEHAVRMAPPFLAQRSQKGFWLMVEGAQIDWGGHANQTEYIIQEMIDFDKAIGALLDFAEADGETLVIITADHETGGFSILPGSTREKIIGGFTTDQHTATMIPVFAFGPGAELFSGIYENTEIHKKMRIVFGF